MRVWSRVQLQPFCPSLTTSVAKVAQPQRSSLAFLCCNSGSAPNRGEKSEEDKRPLVYIQNKVEMASTHSVERCLDPNLTPGGYDLDEEFWVKWN